MEVYMLDTTASVNYILPNMSYKQLQNVITNN